MQKCFNTETSLIEQRKVRYSDVDLNGHLNNASYIDYKGTYDEYIHFDSFSMSWITSFILV